MSIDVATARQRFAHSLEGKWESYLGGGSDMLIGMSLTFHNDDTGMMEEWGFDHQHLDPAYVTDPAFRWRSVADWTIELTHRGETREVKYDFRSRKNEYGISELRVFEIGRAPDQHGEIGFWLSPFSLVYHAPDTTHALRRIWKRFTG